MKQFEIETKIGPVYARVNGANEILVDTIKHRKDYTEQDQDVPVTIRGIAHKGNVRFGYTGTEWDGRTYDYDGNTVIFVSKHGTEYMMARAVWLNRAGSFGGNDATHAAKLKFYTEIKAAVNLYWRHHEKEIRAEIDARLAEKRQEKIENLRSTIQDLSEKLCQAQLELRGLTGEPCVGLDMSRA